MTIHYPIPLEAKQYYFLLQIESIIKDNASSINLDTDLILQKIMPVIRNLKETAWVDLKAKSPQKLRNMPVKY